MLINYVKLSLRLLIRNPLLTGINIAGLSVGFAVFFILWQYTQFELSYDRFQKDWKNIVRAGLVFHWTDDGRQWNEHTFGINYPEISNRIANELPEIVETTRIFNQSTFTPEYIPDHGKEVFFTVLDDRQEKNSFIENNIAYADSNLFRFFSLPLLKGDPLTVLSEPNSVVLSGIVASKYFGDKDPIGRTLSLNDRVTLKVTGVFADLPSNTHLTFDLVISTTGIRNSINKLIFSPGGPHCYYKLQEGTDIAALQQKINKYSEKYWLEIFGNIYKNRNETFLQPLSEMHLNEYMWDNYKGQSKFFVVVLRAVSVVVLFMAWINYTNLTIFSCRKRTRELATRKAVGAKSLDIVKQFFTEAFLINFISACLAVTIIQLVRYPSELLFDFYIPAWSEITPLTLIILACFFGAGLLITGAYPAIITLKNNPLDLFRNNKINTFNNTGSEWLTIFQFASSTVLIIWIFTVFNQINFILNRSIGINKDHVMVIELPIGRDQNFNSILNSYLLSIKAIPGIEDQTVSLCITGDSEDNSHNVTAIKRIETIQGGMVYTNGGVDENFIPFFGIKFLAGRNFQSDRPADKNAIIVSKGALIRLGFESPEDAVGKRIEVAESSFPKEEPAEIIGVIDDYPQRTFVIVEGTGTGLFGIALTYKDYLVRRHIPKRISVRIRTENAEAVINKLEDLYRSHFHGNVFTSYFLDDHVNRHYKDEKIARNQIMLFTSIAIGIACLGLLGMISNIVVERTKEIGIRKIMGARLYHIAEVLLRTTMKQMLIATILGIPVAYYMIGLYLQKFSEQISLEWWYFAFPVVILLSIMFATIATVLYKAANANPVESLRYE